MQTRGGIKKYCTGLAALLCVFTVLNLPAPPEAKAQLTLGARGASMGQATTALNGDIWNVFSNPALLPDSAHAVSFYGIRNYGLSELTDVALAGHITTVWGTAGIGLHSYGDELFRESRYRLGYMNSYSGIQAGIIVNYTHFFIQDHGSAGSVTIDTGLAYSIIEALWLGARVTNMTRARIGQAAEELPRELAIGLSYRLADRAQFTSDLVKDARFPVSYRGGLEVRVYEEFRARGGITTEPVTYSLGMGYSFSSFGINVVAQQHYVLGWSPGFDLNINFQ